MPVPRPRVTIWYVISLQCSSYTTLFRFHIVDIFVLFFRFRLEDDLHARVANGKTIQKQFQERSARFSLYESRSNSENFSKRDKFVMPWTGSFLDKLMAEIPGAPGCDRLSRSENLPLSNFWPSTAEINCLCSNCCSCNNTPTGYLTSSVIIAVIKFYYTL